MEDQILKIGMKDTIRYCNIALPIIMLFEVLMLFSWVLNVDDKSSPGALGYLIGYITLFVISALVMFYANAIKRHYETKFRHLYVMQHIYAVAIVLWAVCFTYVGSTYRGNFDYLIFITIITITPLFTFLKPYFWVLLQLAGSVAMYCMALQHDHFFSFAVNFTIFTIISIAAGLTTFLTRRKSIIRQIELEQEKDIAYQLAHIDTLTQLPNRQSCTEELNELREEMPTTEVVVVIFDINGLKVVNDTYGHLAGDELIQGAATCITASYGKHGHVYRVGGDEFIAILYCTEEELEEAATRFDWEVQNWRGQRVKRLSISVGVSTSRSDPGCRIDDILTKADNIMLEEKKLHYRNR